MTYNIYYQIKDEQYFRTNISGESGPGEIRRWCNCDRFDHDLST